jgi:hypothetical protein
MLPRSQCWRILLFVVLKWLRKDQVSAHRGFLERVFPGWVLGKGKYTNVNNPLHRGTASISVAHVGNSIQCYSDTPRLLQQMLQTRFLLAFQDSMIRPGGTFKSMLLRGNNFIERVNITAATLPDGTVDLGAPDVTTLFAERSWDFVVMNDRTTQAAQTEDREESLFWLETGYAPIFPSNAQAVFIQTAADRVEDNRDSTNGMGDFDEFTSATREGYQAYADLFHSLSIPAIIAPVGDAYGVVRETLGEDMFDMLYSPDNIHPSPHGTWLQCCLLYCMMIGEEPPTYEAAWWYSARFVEERDRVSNPFIVIPFPTDAEAEDLRQVAIGMCNL